MSFIQDSIDRNRRKCGLRAKAENQPLSGFWRKKQCIWRNQIWLKSDRTPKFWTKRCGTVKLSKSMNLMLTNQKDSDLHEGAGEEVNSPAGGARGVGGVVVGGVPIYSTSRFWFQTSQHLVDVRDAWREAEDFVSVAGIARIRIFDCWTPVWGVSLSLSVVFLCVFLCQYLQCLIRIRADWKYSPVVRINSNVRGAFTCSQEL